jgi:hypothetical protein
LFRVNVWRRKTFTNGSPERGGEGASKENEVVGELTRHIESYDNVGTRRKYLSA